MHGRCVELARLACGVQRLHVCGNAHSTVAQPRGPQVTAAESFFRLERSFEIPTCSTIPVSAATTPLPARPIVMRSSDLLALGVFLVAPACGGDTAGSGSDPDTDTATDGTEDGADATAEGGSGGPSGPNSSGDSGSSGVDSDGSSGETDSGTNPVCGDGVAEGDEVCDGVDLGGRSCADNGFDAGQAACLEDCSGLDVSGCVFVCQAQEFGESVAWDLPGGATPGQTIMHATSGFSSDGRGNYVSWSLVDIDQDGSLDLVETSRSDDDGVGRGHWLVFVGDGGGFASESIDWALPNIATPGQTTMHTTSGSSSDGDGSYVSWSLLDIDQDGRLDLVQTSRSDDDQVGRSRWMVFPGVEGGFASEASDWSLPGSGTPGQTVMHATSGSSSDGEGAYVSWSMLDIDHNGQLDLVLTSRSDDDGVGRARWMVFTGTDNGFSDDAIDWGLPGSATPGQTLMHTTSGSSSDGDGAYVSWSLVDIDADGQLDLVDTSRSDDDELGRSRWLVFAGGNNGFASDASDWSLPNSATPGQTVMHTISGSSSDGEGSYVSWSLVDLDHDGRLDLVETSRSDDEALGRAHWQLFPGDDGGFQEAAVDWTLPSSATPGDTVLHMPWGSSSDGDGSYVSWALVALDGDQFLDLVVTSNSAGEDLGVTHWSVHHGCQ